MQAIEIVEVSIGQVRALLERSALPTEDLDAGTVQLIGARLRDAMVGCIGIERHGSQALIRSLAVEEGHRGFGVGAVLVESALERASAAGMIEAFCVTTDAAEYLSRFDFEMVDRTAIVGSVTDATQLRGVCPESAIVMRRALRVDNALAD